MQVSVPQPQQRHAHRRGKAGGAQQSAGSARSPQWPQPFSYQHTGRGQTQEHACLGGNNNVLWPHDCAHTSKTSSKRADLTAQKTDSQKTAASQKLPTCHTAVRHAPLAPASTHTHTHQVKMPQQPHSGRQWCSRASRQHTTTARHKHAASELPTSPGARLCPPLRPSRLQTRAQPAGRWRRQRPCSPQPPPPHHSQPAQQQRPRPLP